MISLSLQKVADTLNASLIGDDKKFKGCSTDTRTVQKGELFVALHGPSFNGHDYLDIAAERGAAAAMVDQDVTSNLPLIRVDNTRKALGQLAAMWRDLMDIPVVAITGSNGKTTVKEMLSAILSCSGNVLATHGNLNNDIGVPQTLFILDKHHDFAVIEMGANHAGEIAQLCKIAKPLVSVVTLCAPAHLEGFGSIEGVANAKGEIFQSLPEQGTAVINSDDEFAPVWEQMASACKRTTFGMSDSADVTAGNIQYDAEGSCFDLRISSQQVEVRLPLPGQHNIINALAAAACANVLNISLSDIRDGLQTMQPVSGRLQLKVGKLCSIIDDTYNANPASYIAAVDVLLKTSGSHWVVLGDMGELGESASSLHAEAGRKAKLAGVDRLYAIGDLTRHAVTEFGHEAKHFINYETLIETIKQDLEREQDKDVTLLIKGSRAAHMESVVQALEIEGGGHVIDPC